MKRRDVLAGAICVGVLPGCTSFPSDSPDASNPPEVSNRTIETCEQAYLGDRKSGDPNPDVVSTEVSGDWRTYTVESEWGHSYRDSDDQVVIVDHYERAYFHAGDEGIYRTEGAETDPTSGQKMNC